MLIFYTDTEFTMGGRSGGIPFHITTGMPDWVFYVAFIIVIFMSVIIFFAIRKDKHAGLTQKEREQTAIDFLLNSMRKTVPLPKRRRKSEK